MGEGRTMQDAYMDIGGRATQRLNSELIERASYWHMKPILGLVFPCKEAVSERQ